LKLKHSSTHSAVFPGLGTHSAARVRATLPARARRARERARERTVGLPSVGYLHCVLSRQNEFLPVNKRVDFTTVNQATGCSCSAPVFALFPRLPFERDYMDVRMYACIRAKCPRNRALPSCRKKPDR